MSQNAYSYEIHYDELLDPRDLDLNNIKGKVFALDRYLYHPLKRCEFFEYVKEWIINSGGIIDKKLDDKTDYLLLMDYGYEYEYDPETEDEFDVDEIPSFESDYIQWMHRLNKKGYGIRAICINDLYLYLKDKFIYFKDRLNVSDSDMYIFQGNLLKYKGTEENVTVPEGTLIISHDAFYKNEKIENIIVPNSVYLIEAGAFCGCKNLRQITLSNNILEIDEDSFKECTSLEEIVIPPNVKSISEQAFMGCTCLKKVVLPDGIERIEYMAFEGADSLKDINIPDSLVCIDKNAFGWMHPMIFTYNGIEYVDDIIINEEDFNENVLIVPNHIRRITKSAFEKSNLIFVDFNHSIEIVGPWAFASCKELTSVDLGNRLRIISRYSFSNCSKLSEIELKESIEKIEDGAFANCTLLSKVFIYGKPQIGKDIFKGCEDVVIYCTNDNYDYLRDKIDSPCIVLDDKNTYKIGEFYKNIDNYIDGTKKFDDELYFDRKEEKLSLEGQEITIVTNFADDFRKIRMLREVYWYDMYEAIKTWMKVVAMPREMFEDAYYPQPLPIKVAHIKYKTTELHREKADKRLSFIKHFAYRLYDELFLKNVLLDLKKDFEGNFENQSRAIIATTGMVNENNDIIELYAEFLAEDKIRICVKYKRLSIEELKLIEKDYLSKNYFNLLS